MFCGLAYTCWYILSTFLIMSHSPWSLSKNKFEKYLIYRLSLNHLTFSPYSWNTAAPWCASPLKLDWWEHAWGNKRQLFLWCSSHRERFQKLHSQKRDLLIFYCHDSCCETGTDVIWNGDSLTSVCVREILIKSLQIGRCG